VACLTIRSSRAICSLSSLSSSRCGEGQPTAAHANRLHRSVRISCRAVVHRCRIGVAVYRTSVRNERPRGYFGSPQRGRALLSAYGCPACHPTPGLPEVGIVGPPLSHIGSRSYIAGRFPNERIDMELWLQHPQTMKPGTAMPDLGVSERDARDMATYLATLK
jgi:cytochrome c